MGQTMFSSEPFGVPTLLKDPLRRIGYTSAAMKFLALAVLQHGWSSIEGLGKLITLANWGIAASLAFGCVFTVIAIKAGSKKDDLVRIEDLRKTEQIANTMKLAGDASERATNLERANLTLRG